MFDEGRNCTGTIFYLRFNLACLLHQSNLRIHQWNQTKQLMLLIDLDLIEWWMEIDWMQASSKPEFGPRTIGAYFIQCCSQFGFFAVNQINWSLFHCRNETKLKFDLRQERNQMEQHEWFIFLFLLYSINLYL